MVWMLSIGCVTSALCGLTKDWNGTLLYPTEQECVQTGNRVIAMVVGAKQAKNFQVKCHLEGS